MLKAPLTISQTQAGLIDRQFSAVELVDSYLESISKKNPKLNIFLTVPEEVAYRQARQADQAVAELGQKAPEKYPLLGCVVAHKDLFLTKGIRSTAGSRVLQDYIPAYSATVVSRIEKAGGITIGKTNCDAWAHGASGENSDFGPTKNPWNSAYVPGGSSSGSAAAVAANLTLLATGTDTGGSIRQPASFCGVFGLKPTYGAVPRYGVVAMASSLDSMGHFARTGSDIKKIFAVTKGQDGKDSTLRDGPYAEASPRLKIGLPKEYFVKGVTRQVEEAVKKAADLFKKQGMEIVEISLPHTQYAISVYYIVQPAEVSSNLGRYDGIRYGGKRESFGAEAKRRIMLGTYVLSSGYYDAYYLKAMQVRSKIIEDFDKAWQKVDAIIAPVSPTPPFKLGEKAADPLQMYLADIFTVAGNLAGIPGLSVPSGFSQEGLPLGFQLLGPRFSEQVLFSLAELYEKASDYKPKVAEKI
jgi:aspartyl-tRNA(Asn)/glutamyl-tRNA(Gln) amidotransferase subunit A